MVRVKKITQKGAGFDVGFDVDKGGVVRPEEGARPPVMLGLMGCPGGEGGSSISRRGFLAASSAAVVAAKLGGFPAQGAEPTKHAEARGRMGSAGETELAKRGIDALLRLDEGTQSRYLVQLEREIAAKTSVGRAAKPFINSIPKPSVLPHDAPKSEGETETTRGSLKPAEDAITIYKPPAGDWITFLLKGTPILWMEGFHEATHFVNDQHNPDEWFMDMLLASPTVNRLMSEGGVANSKWRTVTDARTGDWRVVPDDPVSEFVSAYAKRVFPNDEARLFKPNTPFDEKAIMQLCNTVTVNARARQDRYYRRMREGGLVLTETHAHMQLHGFDYVGLEKGGVKAFKRALFDAIEHNLGGSGLNLDEKQFSAAFEGVTKLYALHTRLRSTERATHERAARIHRDVAVDVGRAMLSYDPRTGRYTEFDRRIKDLTDRTGTGDKLDGMAEEWVNQLLNVRAQDQRITQSETSQFFSRHCATLEKLDRDRMLAQQQKPGEKVIDLTKPVPQTVPLDGKGVIIIKRWNPDLWRRPPKNKRE